MLLEFFVDALDPTIAFVIEPPEQFRIEADFGGVNRRRHLAALANNRPHRLVTEAKLTGDLTRRQAFLVQEEDGFTLVRSDHGIGGEFGERRWCD